MKPMYAWMGLMLTAATGVAAQSPYHLKVLSWSCQVSPQGAIVRGTVTNISTKPISNLRANARVLGRGLRVSTNSAPVHTRTLQPGQTTSFSVRVRTNFDSQKRCELGFRSPVLIQIAALVPDPSKPEGL
ncbi:MAG: hypothetical protein C4332_00370 [Meiothermus sp.]